MKRPVFFREPEKEKLPDFCRTFRTIILEPDGKDMLCRNLVHRELLIGNHAKPEEPLRHGLLPSIGSTPFQNESNVNFILHPNDKMKPKEA